MPPLMTFPERSSFETDRQRRDRLALSRDVKREPKDYGKRRPKPGAYVRLSASDVAMTFASFKAADYGQLCQALGLRPSKPNAPAAA